MAHRHMAIVAAAAGLVITMAGCSSDQQAADAASSAAASISEAVTEAASAAASEAASAASEMASEAASAASEMASEAASALSSATSAAAGGTYTMDDVSQHSTSGDCWVAIDGKVYDVSAWEANHPGGPDKIAALCGTDATQAFSGQHGSSPKPNATLAGFMIGTLS